MTSADEVAQQALKAAARTARPELLEGVGPFAAAMRVPLERYREPVLVMGADGVGSKLELAFASGRHATVGIDLVAMCVDDIATQGAEPFAFLDQLSLGRLDPAVTAAVLEGIAEGCVQAGCALVGGETAVLPSFHAPGRYDLAGFALGLVERTRRIDGASCRAGDELLGFAASGLHANGFTTARRVLLEEARLPLDGAPPGFDLPLLDLLLQPTRIYARALLALRERVELRALAHITGGGLLENVPRTLPRGLVAVLDRRAWPQHPLCDLMQRLGRLSAGEMARTFNLGIGMTAVVPAGEGARAVAEASSLGLQAFVIGRLETGSGDEAVIEQLT